MLPWCEIFAAKALPLTKATCHGYIIFKRAPISKIQKILPTKLKIWAQMKTSGGGVPKQRVNKVWAFANKREVAAHSDPHSPRRCLVPNSRCPWQVRAARALSGSEWLAVRRFRADFAVGSKGS